MLCRRNYSHFKIPIILIQNRKQSPRRLRKNFFSFFKHKIVGLKKDDTTLIVVKDLLTLSMYCSENDWFKVRRNKRRYPKRTGNQRGREICQL